MKRTRKKLREVTLWHFYNILLVTPWVLFNVGGVSEHENQEERFTGTTLEAGCRRELITPISQMKKPEAQPGSPKAGA